MKLHSLAMDNKDRERVAADRDELRAAVAALRAGEIVLYPTETLYGLAADAYSPIALERLIALKGREATKAVALIAADHEMAFAVAREVPAIARQLADRFWPGPLTLVMPARAGLHPILIGPDGGVGVRVSSHPIARELARQLGRPITATSANRAGAPPVATIAAARAEFGDEIEVLLEDRALTGGAPSTVVACDHTGWRVLRPGAIATASLAAALAG